MSQCDWCKGEAVKQVAIDRKPVNLCQACLDVHTAPRNAEEAAYFAMQEENLRGLRPQWSPTPTGAHRAHPLAGVR
jgi:hypothetical protein